MRSRKKREKKGWGPRHMMCIHMIFEARYTHDVFARKEAAEKRRGVEPVRIYMIFGAWDTQDVVPQNEVGRGKKGGRPSRLAFT